MRFVSSKLATTLYVITAITFLWFALFGLIYHMGGVMATDAAEGCLFGGETRVCTMTFSKHISLWRGVITSLPERIGLFAIFALLVPLISFASFAKGSLGEFFRRIALRWRLYRKQNPHIKLFDFLREAFSRGILNPKVFNLAF